MIAKFVESAAGMCKKRDKGQLRRRDMRMRARKGMISSEIGRCPRVTGGKMLKGKRTSFSSEDKSTQSTSFINKETNGWVTQARGGRWGCW